ncbi:hypothetical protein AJ80_06830 [Polytolypa hystricis UAMH7299]|uniref:Uncharacterized protein n=1 Tax=Polytolypa hystricis (strain UAMH7299) TaxID=1447883 RepID=A0A2B7XT19_POLH7|nr:hypothetical protein AJ80_06830 [Polytolypa hystricis UAMH7299]
MSTTHEQGKEDEEDSSVLPPTTAEFSPGIPGTILHEPTRPTSPPRTSQDTLPLPDASASVFDPRAVLKVGGDGIFVR